MMGTLASVPAAFEEDPLSNAPTSATLTLPVGVDEEVTVVVAI